MISMKRISLIGSAFRAAALPGPSTRVLSLRSFRLALLAAMVLAGLAFWSTTADGQEAEEPVWSADMTVVEYNSVSIGAASADLFSNVGGSGNLQIKSLWSYIPGRDLRLAFQEGVPDAADYTLQVGGLSLEFPADSSGESDFQWNDVDVQWEDGQVIHARIVPTAEIDAPQANTPATGVPTVSGTAQVGETLTADTSSVADADGLTNVSYAYQWIRTDGGADTDIAGATDSAYTLTGDDQGKTIKLRVTFNDDNGNSETLTSAATAEVSEKAQFLVSNLGISVAAGIMRPLSAARSGFAQAFTTGAETGGYALGSVGIQVSHFFDESTVGDHLRVTLNGVATEGEPGEAHCTLTNPSSFSTPGVIAFAAPAGAGSCPQLAAETTYFVVIEWVNPSGTDAFALIPQTFPTEETAATDEDPGGAEGWSIADQSHYLTAGSDARTWNAYAETASFKIKVKEAAVTAARVNSPATGLPTITGTAQVGETLTADTSGIADPDGLDNAVFSYQWIRSDGNTDTDIAGATGSTYTLVSADVGKAIKVRVSFTDDGGNTESQTSAATAAVAARANTPATGAPAIAGTAQVDETLTADTSGIADQDGLTNATFTYQWVADDTDIDGASNSTYTLVAADEGKTIKVKVSFTDDAGNQESVTSAATAAVATVPGQPEHLNVSPHGAGALDLDWEAPGSDGGLPITGYKVQWKEEADSWDRPEDVSEETVTGATHTINGLTEGVEYAVRVMATNEVGEGPASAEKTGIPGETRAPEKVRSRVDGATLRVLYDEALDEGEGSAPPPDAFDVRVACKCDSTNWRDEEARREVDSVSVDGDTVVLTLAKAATAEDYVVVSYTPPSDAAAARTRDQAGNPAAGFGFSQVFNDTEEAAETEDTSEADTPLTASLETTPEAHDGETPFTFELRFSEEFELSYKTLRDHAFTVVGGSVEKAKRLEKGSNIGWRITVQPDADGDVTITLPATEDCGDTGAICTEDGRMLSNRLELTVSGPGQ